jgi:hypothetical protein
VRRQPRRSSRRSGLPWEAASRRTASSRRTTRGQGPFQAQPPRPARPSQGRLAQPARVEFRRCRPSCRPTRRARPLPRGTASLRQAETGSPNRGGCAVVENDPRPRHCRRVRGGGHSETESGPGLSVGTGVASRASASRGAHPQVVAVLRDGRRSTRTPTASERVMMLALACCTWAVSLASPDRRARVAPARATRGDETPPSRPAVMCLQKELRAASAAHASLISTYTRCITHTPARNVLWDIN